MKHNTETSYGSVTKAFHWTVAVLFLAQIIMGIIMSFMPTIPLKFQIYTVHKSIGIILVFLSIAFISWTFCNPKPRWPDHMPERERLVAAVAHGVLYALLLVMSLSGWIMATASGHIPLFLGWFPAPLPGIPTSPELSKFAAGVHYYAAWLSGLLVALHIAAAIKHHRVDKDDILNRMLPKKFCFKDSK